MFSRCQFEIPMPKIACIGSHFIRIELLLLSIWAAYNRRITHLLLQLQKMLLSLLLGFSLVSQLLQLMIFFMYLLSLKMFSLTFPKFYSFYKNHWTICLCLRIRFTPWIFLSFRTSTNTLILHKFKCQTTFKSSANR